MLQGRLQKQRCGLGTKIQPRDGERISNHLIRPSLVEHPHNMPKGQNIRYARIAALRRMSPSTGRAAASPKMDEGPQWAGLAGVRRAVG